MKDNDIVEEDGIKRFEVGPFSTNCYLLDRRYIVDPGGMDPSLEKDLEGIEQLEAILLTHTHGDHIAAIDEVIERFPDCRILCHSKEFDMLADPSQNLSQMSGRRISFEADAPIEDARLTVGGDSLDVLFTPGHSPGGISLFWESKNSVLTGDALFKGGVGRTDFPGTSRERLDRSLHEVLMTLPEETKVYPGHGPPSTIGREKQTNPFL